MEDDLDQTPSNIMPLALTVLAIVLGCAGLYFGLSANQRIKAVDASVAAGSSSSVRVQQQIDEFDSQITAMVARVAEQDKTISRLRVYSSQGEKAVKQLATELQANREQIVKTAEALNAFAAAGFRPAASANAEASSSPPAAQDGERAATATGAAGSATRYTIAAGDTFARIASKIGVGVQAIIDANPEVDPRRLAIGQVIEIPVQP